MEFRRQTLENGLEIIAERHPQAYSAALAFFVKTGARDEDPEVAGVSHFLEHMAFKGTPSRSADDVNRELDEMGAHANAYTSEEQTVYYAAVLPEYQQRALELLADIMRPALRKEDFDLEKQVILEEIAKYEDQPPFGAHEKAMAAHFGPHPLGRAVLGRPETVGRLSVGQMRDYFQRRYGPNNMLLAAAGDVDFARLVELARRCCGHWTPQPAERPTPPARPQRRFEVYRRKEAAQQYILRLASGPAAEQAERFAGRLLASIFGDDSGSRLYWAFVDSGLAECAATGAYEFQGAGVFLTYLACAPELAADNLARLDQLERQLLQDGVTAQELELAKAKLCAQTVLHSERAVNRLFSIGANWLQRRQYMSVRDVVEAYRAVTLEQVNQLARRFPLTEHTTVAVGPLEQLAGAAAAPT